jgi:eukaryotic-like serine/threonine-protein kinase
MSDELPPRVAASRDATMTQPEIPDSYSVHSMLQEPSPENPLRFGHYQLYRRIGAGGMGEVFLAREEGITPRACVVKKILPTLLSTRAFVGRFLDEAKVVVRLKHPNIGRVYTVGDVDGEYFMAMEYIQGKTVSRLTRRLREQQRNIPLGLVLLIGERVCRGLQYAHDATDERKQPLRLVHRDLSPANVCMSYRGEVKIIDFGAAHSTLKEERTAPRVVIGNLTYMAPEQAKKQSIDGRADVYACGVMLWELLAGFALPQKGDPVERWKKAVNPIWEPPSVHNPAVPPDVDTVILKAMAKEPEQRFQSAAELAEALQSLHQRHAPQVDESALSALLADVFANEKATETEVLTELLYGKTLSKVDGKGVGAKESPPVKAPISEPAKNVRPTDDPRHTHAIDMEAVLEAHRAVASQPVTAPRGRDVRSTEVLPFSSIRNHAKRSNVAATTLPWWAMAVLYGGVFALSLMLGFFAVWLKLRH